MKLTVDTNILVRAFVEDDEAQAAIAKALLGKATLIAISIPVFCEFAWVLGRSYKIPSTDIASAIGALLDTETVTTDGPAVEAGIAMLREGGDFADGAIAAQGEALGGNIMVSFDKTALALWGKAGRSVIDPMSLDRA